MKKNKVLKKIKSNIIIIRLILFIILILFLYAGIYFDEIYTKDQDANFWCIPVFIVSFVFALCTGSVFIGDCLVRRYKAFEYEGHQIIIYITFFKAIIYVDEKNKKLIKKTSENVEVQLDNNCSVILEILRPFYFNIKGIKNGIIEEIGD